jgi:hypothetical protein
MHAIPRQRGLFSHSVLLHALRRGAAANVIAGTQSGIASPPSL